MDYKTRRSLDKALFQNLLTGKWIKDKKNLMITGPCGVGKTWLACTLAQGRAEKVSLSSTNARRVCLMYSNWPMAPLMHVNMHRCAVDGRFPRIFKALMKIQQLILDDWVPDRLNASQRRDLMEIVEDRYGNGSSLITSQRPISTLHDVIGGPTFADAILDRLVHSAYRIELGGQLFRKQRVKSGDETPAN